MTMGLHFSLIFFASQKRVINSFGSARGIPLSWRSLFVLHPVPRIDWGQNNKDLFIRAACVQAHRIYINFLSLSKAAHQMMMVMAMLELLPRVNWSLLIATEACIIT
jgi:hypothetical protein